MGLEQVRLRARRCCRIRIVSMASVLTLGCMPGHVTGAGGPNSGGGLGGDRPPTSGGTGGNLDGGIGRPPGGGGSPEASGPGGGGDNGGFAGSSATAGRGGGIGTAVGGSGGTLGQPGVGGQSEMDGKGLAGSGVRATGGMAGTTSSTAGTGGSTAGSTGSTPTVVAVGFGGVRVRSIDLGLTWAKEAEIDAHGGDDPNLLRSIAYGNGVWVTSGTENGPLLTSTDGVVWTEHPRPPLCIESIAFGNGQFVSICGGSTMTSVNGINWTNGPHVGDLDLHTYIVFGEGVFAAYGREVQTVYTSPNGKTWTEKTGLSSAAVCGGVIRNGDDCHNAVSSSDVWLRSDGGDIVRSTNGIDWQVVYSDDHGNAIFGDDPYQAIAFGQSP